MKARFLLLVLVSGIVSGTMGQNTIDLTFTAVDSAAYVYLDSLKIMNRTQGIDTVVYWPDTSLLLEITPGDSLLFIGYVTFNPVGVGSLSKGEKKFQLFQSYPNPVRDQSVISVYLPSNGQVNIMVTDVRGRIAMNFDRELDAGTHSFSFQPGDERMYFITARWNGITQSIKILTDGQTGGKTCKLEYTGLDHENPSLKQSQPKAGLMVQESGIVDTPDNDTTYTFQFATNIPCPGTPTVNYEGQVYNTIQIYSQCWLKENLNVGIMIPGTQDMSNNSVIEKYCYSNAESNCTYYGGLYQWDEMMQYTLQQGVQGICPSGWHVPTDEEWKILEGAVDSKYGIGDPEWDIGYVPRGFDADANLKTTSGWFYNGSGLDLFGFSGLPGGRGGYIFEDLGSNGFWFTSTDAGGGFEWSHHLCSGCLGVDRGPFSKGFGFSVRCVKEN